MTTTVKRVSGDVAQRIDLEIRKANTMNFQFVFAATNGTALDLTGYTAINFEVLNSQQSQILTADLSTGLVISGAGNNVLTLTKSEVDTDLPAGNNYMYRLTLTKTNYVRQVLNGYFAITNELVVPNAPRALDGVTTNFIDGAQYTITVSNNI